MTGFHDKGLILCHFFQVAFDQKVLHPVMADGSCFTIGDQFIRIEGNFKVQVVVNHDLESFAFRAFSFIFINWFAIDAAFRAETIAIDTAASRQFFEELWDKFIMIFFRNVAQGIFQCQFSLGRAEAEAAVRGSADAFLERFLRRKSIGEFQFDCHCLCDISIFHVVTTPSFTRYPDERGFSPISFTTLFYRFII